jgi:2-polyprenyl-3-methyl-5-hydroxy-6-metoxy-1,4-benzoquinol methylase
MTETQGTTTVDQARLKELVGRVATDVGGALALPLALVGDRLGLFSALAAVDGPVTAGQLAERTGLTERYLREWLLAMAAAGYVTYAGGDKGPEAKRTARYRLSPEQAEAFTNADSPEYVAGRFQTITAAIRIVDRLTEAFRTGEGISWGEQHPDLFEGLERRVFGPGYMANLTSSWIPSLAGIEERLVRGARVADVGCGFGASTIIMAKAYPNSTFVGIDSHAPSIATARDRAAAAGVADRITFRTAGAADLDGSYDLIAFFDSLHDMSDPVAALRAARPAVAPGGRVMLVEPMSWDTVEESLSNPLGRFEAASSLFVCLPNGLSSPPALGLGSQAGPTRILQLAEEAGFGDARIVMSTELNLVYELAL